MIQIENTPNPNALKFLSDNKISEVGTKEFQKSKINEMIVLNSRSEFSRGLWKPYKNIFQLLKPVGSVAYKLGLTAAGKARAVNRGSSRRFIKSFT